MRYEADSLDYLALVNEARSCRAPDGAKGLRIALLADFATQQLVPILKALFARNGVAATIYDADYDSIDAEILHPDSGLYAFGPRYVIILVASEKLKARVYGADDRSALVDQVVGRLTNLWAALERRGPVTIIQGNYVLPSERAFGHYELKVEDSVGSVVAEINHRLVSSARSARNVLLCDVDHLAADVGRRNWFDESLWAMAKGFCRLDYLPLLAQSLVDITLAGEGAIIKCVVLDLDNTLWGGVIGDDGLAGIILGDFDEGEVFVAFQRFIRELRRRGVILAVVSKNDEANALLPFREHPNMVLREQDIAIFIANWEVKADNIRLVQKATNIGFDSFVFLDDNPFERGVVRKLIPDVVVPELPDDPSIWIKALDRLNLFETSSHSAADRQRPAQYREEAHRELAKQVFTNIDDYLRSLCMTANVERFKPFNLPRIAQLTQRSNQFNLTTKRLNEASCAALMNDGARWFPFTLTLSDKFGDYGLVSVVILKLEPEEVEIDAYMMSCRVLRRGVEQFVMNTIFAEAARRGAKRVVGRYLATAKNSMVKNLYADFGFARIDEQPNGNSVWILSPSAYAAKDTLISAQPSGALSSEALFGA